MKKTLSFAVLHFSIAFTVAYLLTGSLIIGGTLALIEPAVNTVGFYFHEKVWTRMERRKAGVSSRNAMAPAFSQVQPV
ncbi:DUF2061 domain-containing protein [Allohahella marinimesophila]|uniref:DUF2061 domain-containing protein n=1 Tax=Allohahella marinimesophila TaxID=1054972 RepID=A0ABP7Q4C0_9GAMM